MSRWTIVAPIAVAVTAGVAYFVTQQNPRGASPSVDAEGTMRESPTPVSVSAPRERPPAEGGTTRRVTPPNPGAHDYASRFAQSRDYQQFGESLLAAAEAGDRDAQFYLFEAVSYCDRMYPFFFIRRQKRRTLDEAMQWASARTNAGLRYEEVRDVYDRCHRMKEDEVMPLGNSAAWLQRATDQGQPLALSVTAEKLLLDATTAELQGFADQQEQRAVQEQRQRAKQFLSDAVKSKDPHVLWKMGDLQGMIGSNTTDTSTQEWAWRLAACERGYPCDSNAEWHEMLCRFDVNCQPGEDALDVVRRATGNAFLEISDLAREINEKIDAERWEELGLPPMK